MLWDMGSLDVTIGGLAPKPTPLISVLCREVWGGILPWEGQRLFLGGSDTHAGIPQVRGICRHTGKGKDREERASLASWRHLSKAAGV